MSDGQFIASFFAYLFLFIVSSVALRRSKKARLPGESDVDDWGLGLILLARLASLAGMIGVVVIALTR
jgi:hypothetical protein